MRGYSESFPVGIPSQGKLFLEFWDTGSETIVGLYGEDRYEDTLHGNSVLILAPDSTWVSPTANPRWVVTRVK